MHDHQSRMGGVAQTEERLTEGGHGAGVIFILIVSRVERVEHDDFGSSGAGSNYEVIQTLGALSKWPVALVSTSRC